MERIKTMRLRCAVALMLAMSGWAAAQNATDNPEELNRKYQDALAQLKAAQDRKNELATENEKLTARIAELEKQNDELRRAAATFAEQTWKLRMHYAAWESFLKTRSPQLLEKWRVFLERDPLSAPASFPDSPDTSTTLPAHSSIGYDH
jgi:chromosome segregation ATPase